MVKRLLGKNAIWAVIFKCINIGAQLLIMPIVYSSTTKSEFGLFTTVSTLTILILTLDFGIINAIKNPLFKAVKSGELNEVNRIVSTSSFFSFVFFILIIIVGVTLTFTYDFHDINISRLQLIVLIIMFGLRYSLQLLHGFNHGYNRFFLNDMLLMLSSLVSLLIILILHFFEKLTLGSSLNIYMSAPVLVYILYLIYFLRIHKDLEISYHNYSHSLLVSLLSSSGVFFFLQVTWLLITNSVPLLLAKNVGLEFAGEYNILARLFSFIYVLNGIIINNQWGKVTEAFLAKDKIRFISILRTQFFVSLMFVVGCVIVLLLSDTIVQLWMRKTINISWINRIQICIFYITMIVLSAQNILMNGIGYFKIQIRLSITNYFLYALMYIVFTYFVVISNQNKILIIPIIIMFLNIVISIPYFKMKVKDSLE